MTGLNFMDNPDDEEDEDDELESAYFPSSVHKKESLYWNLKKSLQGRSFSKIDKQTLKPLQPTTNAACDPQKTSKNKQEKSVPFK